jgi:hypothetical protein
VVPAGRSRTKTETILPIGAIAGELLYNVSVPISVRTGACGAMRTGETVKVTPTGELVSRR